jgi:SAM-dependent methyltransferase
VIMDYHIRSTCRLCGQACLHQVLELASTPPANEFLKKSEIANKQGTFPLGLWECRKCGHIQLPVVVNPERLFRNYVYVSGTSPVFIEHFGNYAGDLLSRFKSFCPPSLVVDIGSNDGTLLRFFKDAGYDVLGVDPAVNIATTATINGIKTLPEFFTPELAERIEKERGKATIITANNVFAHVDDLTSIVEGVKKLLAEDGVFIFEVQYLVDLCNSYLFDMIYHEHLSYHHVGPLISFFESLGMRLFDVERVSTHGGSIRCYVDQGIRKVTASVNKFCELEQSKGLFTPGHIENNAHAIYELAASIDIIESKLKRRFGDLKEANKSIAGYGAPAKSTTLMHQFDLGLNVLDFIVDDNPLKQGLFTPGTGVPIVSSSAIEECKPDYLLILAWNFADSIIKKNQAFRNNGGKFIVPFPEFKEC